MSQLRIRTRTGLALGALLLGAATVTGVAVAAGSPGPAATGTTASFLNTNTGSSLTAAVGGSSPASTPGWAGAHHGHAHHRHGWRRGVDRSAFALLRHTEYGTLVVGSGHSTRTVDIQRGRVTDVTASTVTVTSADGHAVTYLLSPASHIRAPHPSGTRPSLADVANGDWAEVIAVVNNNTATLRLLVAHPYHGPHPGGAASSTTAS